MSRTVSPVLLMAPLITSHLPVRPAAPRAGGRSVLCFSPSLYRLAGRYESPAKKAQVRAPDEI